MFSNIFQEYNFKLGEPIPFTFKFALQLEHEIENDCSHSKLKNCSLEIIVVKFNVFMVFLLLSFYF